jgi:hypothetical protein
VSRAAWNASSENDARKKSEADPQSRRVKAATTWDTQFPGVLFDEGADARRRKAPTVSTGWVRT